MGVSVTATAPRDAGLLRTMGVMALAASTFNVVVAAGIFLIPSDMAAAAGVYAPLAFLACALAMSGIVACFAEGGRRIATSGGCYGYIEAAFGPGAGFVAGVVLFASNVLGCGGIAAALAENIAGLAAPQWHAATRMVAVLLVLGGCAVVNFLGTGVSTRLAGVTTVLKLVALAVFLVVGAQAMELQNLTPRADFSPESFGQAMILGVFAMTGMEISLCASGEVRNPDRTIPRALLLVMVSVTALYMAIQLIAQGVLGPSLPGSSAPLADAMARVSPALRFLVLGAAGLSMVGYLGVDLLGSPRILFAFARDGFLPAPLGVVHQATQTPVAAIVCYAVVAMMLALTGTFAGLAILAALAAAALYIAGCLAVWLLAARQGSVPRWLPFAACFGSASMLVLIALGTRAQILGLLAIIAIGALAYWLRRLWRGSNQIST